MKTVSVWKVSQLAEDRYFNQEHEAGVLYYLTDGDNWMDDTECFCDYLETLYVSGRLTQAVIHISCNNRSGHTNAFIQAVESSITRPSHIRPSPTTIYSASTSVYTPSLVSPRIPMRTPKYPDLHCKFITDTVGFVHQEPRRIPKGNCELHHLTLRFIYMVIE